MGRHGDKGDKSGTKKVGREESRQSRGLHGDGGPLMTDNCNLTDNNNSDVGGDDDAKGGK